MRPRPAVGTCGSYFRFRLEPAIRVTVAGKRFQNRALIEPAESYGGAAAIGITRGSGARKPLECDTTRFGRHAAAKEAFLQIVTHADPKTAIDWGARRQPYSPNALWIPYPLVTCGQRSPSQSPDAIRSTFLSRHIFEHPAKSAWRPHRHADGLGSFRLRR